MGKLTRKVDPSAKSGIAPYDGEEPKPGMYRARIIKVAIRKAKNTDTLCYNVFYELAATKPEHKKYDGYSGFADLWLGDKEALLAREAAFYKAVTGKAYKNVEDVNVVFEGDEDDFATASGAEVTKIDGKNPKSRIVKVNIQLEKGSVKDAETGEKYEDRLRVSDIYPSADADEAATKVAAGAEMEDDEMDDAPDFVQSAVADDDEELDEEQSDEELQAEIEARRKELRSRAYGLPKLKEACEAAGIYEKGMDKTALVEAILKYEFEDEDGEDEDAAADAVERAIAGAPDASDEEDSDDEDEEDDDEEEDEEDEEDDEEDEDDPEAELRAELADLDRVALKKRIKANDEAFSVKKSMTDDDLRDAIVTQELDSTPF